LISFDWVFVLWAALFVLCAFIAPAYLGELAGFLGGMSMGMKFHELAWKLQKLQTQKHQRSEAFKGDAHLIMLKRSKVPLGSPAIKDKIPIHVVFFDDFNSCAQSQFLACIRFEPCANKSILI